MSKVLVDRELLASLERLTGALGSGSGWVETSAKLRAILAKPAEVEGVDRHCMIESMCVNPSRCEMTLDQENKQAPTKDEVQAVIRNLRCIAKAVLSSEARSSMRADLESAIRLLATHPAQTAPQPEQSETVLVPVSVIEEAAHMLEAHSPGSGSVESFTAQDLRAALSAQGAGDASA